MSESQINRKSLTHSDLKWLRVIYMRNNVISDLNPTQKIVPGPGTYHTVDDINPKGRYNISKFKNSGATVIPPAHSNRWANQKDSNIRTSKN
jgi:hypothetical protein